jgi:hypothetical protein
MSAYTEDTLAQQTTADYLELIGCKSFSANKQEIKT